MRVTRPDREQARGGLGKVMGASCAGKKSPKRLGRGRGKSVTKEESVLCAGCPYVRGNA